MDTLLEEEIRFHRPAGLAVVEMMSVRRTRRHFSNYHEAHAICVSTTRGGAEWIYQGRTYRGGGRMLMLMEPGEAHRTVKLFGETTSFEVLHLDPAWVAGIAEEAGRAPRFAAGHIASPKLHRAWLAVARSLAGAAPRLEKECRLARGLAGLLEGGDGEPDERRSRGLKAARDCIVERCHEELTLDGLADLARLSRFHFLRAFKAAYGMTPHAFLSHVRVAKARRRILSGERLTGTELGFFDQSHFIGSFQRIVGMTPGEYAAAGETES